MRFSSFISESLSYLHTSTSPLDACAQSSGQWDIAVAAAVLSRENVGHARGTHTATSHPERVCAPPCSAQPKTLPCGAGDILCLIATVLEANAIGRRHDIIISFECDQNLWDSVGVCLGQTQGVESHRTLGNHW